MRFESVPGFEPNTKELSRKLPSEDQFSLFISGRVVYNVKPSLLDQSKPRTPLCSGSSLPLSGKLVFFILYESNSSSLAQTSEFMDLIACDVL